MKTFKFCSLISLIFLFLINTTAYAETTPPNLNSEGVVVINSETKTVVYEKNPDTRYFPASTTKVLTALIVIENCNLDDKVTVGKNPPFADGTSIGLKEGEIFTVKELLLGLILESGNDCAESLAEHVSGTKEAFATLMNKRAKEIGATNSNFKNPSGLPDEEHYTTPRDLALIMNEAIKNPTFCEIAKTKQAKFQPSNLDGFERVVNNKNYILSDNSKYYYEYAQYAKKGYTIAANFTNVVSCTKDGNTYVGAFLKGENADAVYPDANNVFNYVFDNYENINLYKKGTKLGEYKINNSTTIPLLLKEDLYYTVKKSDKANLKTSIKVNKPIGYDKKSFNTGDTLTTADISVNGIKYTSVDLVSGTDRTYSPPKVITENFNNHYFTIILGSLISIILLFISRILYVKKKIAKRNINKNRRKDKKKGAGMY